MIANEMAHTDKNRRIYAARDNQEYCRAVEHEDVGVDVYGTLEGDETDQPYELPVVLLTDTIIEPFTVVVKS